MSKPFWNTGYACSLCGEPGAKHDVLPDGAPTNDPYLHACDLCVARAKAINQWKDKP